MRTQQAFPVRPAWIVGVGAALLPVYLWVLDGAAAETFWHVFVGAILLTGLWAVARMPEHQPAWLWILAGQVMFLLGDVGYSFASHLYDDHTMFTFADWFYLSGYPCTAIGMALLIRSQGGRRDLGAVIDGLIVAVGSGVFFWIYLIEPTVADDTMSITDRLIGCAYPAGDLLLITFGAQIAVRQMRRSRPFELLTAAMVVLLGADLGYLYVSLYDGYTMGSLLDIGWWFSYVLVVAAAAHPDAHRLAEPVPDRAQPRLSGRRLAILASIALAAPMALAVRELLGPSPGAPILLGGTMAMFTLVMLRLALVTRELEESRAQLLQEATHDSLTGVTNRVVFADRVAASFERRRTAGPRAAVLFIDLDDFKSVNDSLGHAAGDRLLRIIARRLERLTRPTDTVARLGGDEFAILVGDMPTHVSGVADIADRVIDAIRQPMKLGGDVPIYADASVGIAFVDGHGDADSVLRDADTAMYLAKRRGKGRHLVFETGMRQQVVERLELRADLVGALDRDELTLRYQPVVAVEGGAVHGFEALLRWNHPTRGEVQPGQFISIAEESDLLVPIGRWVLEQACHEAQRWAPSVDGPEISVNVSPVQITEASFADDVRRVLDRSHLAPHRLLLELTESAIADLPDNAAEVLRAVRDLGVRIALDDFGSGHTSLEQLMRLPIDAVKFDRSFVGASLDGDLSVLRGLIQFAHGLGIDTVGEGIETAEQLGRLHDLGCRFAQGYLLARPMAAAEARRVVADGVDLLRAGGDTALTPA